MSLFGRVVPLFAAFAFLVSGGSALAQGKLPWTNEQIQSATKPGRVATFRFERNGGATNTPEFRTERVMGSWSHGFTVMKTVTDANGRLVSRGKDDVLWDMQFASLCLPDTPDQITDEVVSVGAGKFDCKVYRGTEKDEDLDLKVETACWFIKDRPGVIAKWVQTSRDLDGSHPFTETLELVRLSGAQDKELPPPWTQAELEGYLHKGEIVRVQKTTIQGDACTTEFEETEYKEKPGGGSVAVTMTRRDANGQLMGKPVDSLRAWTTTGGHESDTEISDAKINVCGQVFACKLYAVHDDETGFISRTYFIKDKPGIVARAATYYDDGHATFEELVELKE